MRLKLMPFEIVCLLLISLCASNICAEEIEASDTYVKIDLDRIQKLESNVANLDGKSYFELYVGCSQADFDFAFEYLIRSVYLKYPPAVSELSRIYSVGQESIKKNIAASDFWEEKYFNFVDKN